MTSPIYDLGGNTLVVDNIKIGATAPGQSGTDISTTELGYIDGVTAGTVTASKAVVVDASKNIATLGTVASGAITSTAGVTHMSGTAVPATAGAVAAGAPITMFSTGIKIWVTSDVPSHSGTKGDLCINTGGSSTSTRMYVNNGTTNWIAFTTAS